MKSNKILKYLLPVVIVLIIFAIVGKESRLVWKSPDIKGCCGEC